MPKGEVWFYRYCTLYAAACCAAPQLTQGSWREELGNPNTCFELFSPPSSNNLVDRIYVLELNAQSVYTPSRASKIFSVHT